MASSEQWTVKDEIASLERQVQREWDRGDFFRDKLEESLARVSRLEEALKVAYIRIGILRNRMEGCSEEARETGQEDHHGVSMIEVPGWLSEMDGLLSSPDTTQRRGEG